jgi:hypothetical protein
MGNMPGKDRTPHQSRRPRKEQIPRKGRTSCYEQGIRKFIPYWAFHRCQKRSRRTPQFAADFISVHVVRPHPANQSRHGGSIQRRRSDQRFSFFLSRARARGAFYRGRGRAGRFFLPQAQGLGERGWGLSSQSAGTRSLQPLPLAFLPFVPLSIKFGQDVGRDSLVTAPPSHKRLQVGRRVGLEPFLEGAHSIIVTRARSPDKACALWQAWPIVSAPRAATPPRTPSVAKNFRRLM